MSDYIEIIKILPHPNPSPSGEGLYATSIIPPLHLERGLGGEVKKP
jgi:hypothetical protein